MSRAEYEEDLHAELGYRSAGRREVYQREWYSLRGEASEAAPTPKAFETLVNRLRVKNWQRSNPVKRAAKAKRWYNAGGKAVLLAAARSRRRRNYRAEAPVIFCEECSAEFCCVHPPRGGMPRRFCTTNCQERNRQRVKRRENGVRETHCRSCGGAGHNSRRCTSGATSAEVAP